MEAEAGVTAMEVRAGGVTVRVALLLIIRPREALILAVPAATPVANPPDAMVAALVLLLAQVTEEVMI